MEFSQLIILVLVLSFLNCVFIVLGYFAGKHFKIIEIKENETIKTKEISEDNSSLGITTRLLKNEIPKEKEYPEESAYAVSPEDEIKIDQYLREIRNAKEQYRT